MLYAQSKEIRFLLKLFGNTVYPNTCIAKISKLKNHICIKQQNRKSCLNCDKLLHLGEYSTNCMQRACYSQCKFSFIHIPFHIVLILLCVCVCVSALVCVHYLNQILILAKLCYLSSFASHLPHNVLFGVCVINLLVLIAIVL